MDVLLNEVDQWCLLLEVEVVVHEIDCSAFLLDDVLLEAREVEVLPVLLEMVLEVEALEVELLVVSPLVVIEVEVPEVVVVSAVAVHVILEVVQLLEDDVVRPEVKHMEDAGCPPHPGVLAVGGRCHH